MGIRSLAWPQQFSRDGQGNRVHLKSRDCPPPDGIRRIDPPYHGNHDGGQVHHPVRDQGLIPTCSPTCSLCGTFAPVCAIR